jgi:hypothetical protein
MGLRGALPRSAALTVVQGNPGRRPVKKRGGPSARVRADAAKVYRRLMAMGDHYGAIAEQTMADGAKRPSQALWCALRCWKEALIVGYRIGGLPDDTPRPPADPFEAFRQRKPS